MTFETNRSKKMKAEKIWQLFLQLRVSKTQRRRALASFVIHKRISDIFSVFIEQEGEGK
jgi:hypothetical protein